MPLRRLAERHREIGALLQLDLEDACGTVPSDRARPSYCTGCVSVSLLRFKCVCGIMDPEWIKLRNCRRQGALIVGLRGESCFGGPRRASNADAPGAVATAHLHATKLSEQDRNSLCADDFALVSKALSGLQEMAQELHASALKTGSVSLNRRCACGHLSAPPTQASLVAW